MIDEAALESGAIAKPSDKSELIAQPKSLDTREQHAAYKEYSEVITHLSHKGEFKYAIQQDFPALFSDAQELGITPLDVLANLKAAIHTFESTAHHEPTTTVQHLTTALDNIRALIDANPQLKVMTPPTEHRSFLSKFGKNLSGAFSKKQPLPIPEQNSQTLNDYRDSLEEIAKTGSIGIQSFAEWEANARSLGISGESLVVSALTIQELYRVRSTQGPAEEPMVIDLRPHKSNDISGLESILHSFSSTGKYADADDRPSEFRERLMRLGQVKTWPLNQTPK